MPAAMTASPEPKPAELEAAMPRSRSTILPIEISFLGNDLSKPRFENLIDYKLGFDPDVVQPGFMASVPDFEIELKIKEPPGRKEFRFSRDPMGLPRLQWAVNPNPLDLPLRGARLRNDDRLCTLFWGESESELIDASVLAFYVLEYKRLLLKAIPLGIGYLDPDVRKTEAERLAAGKNPEAVGSASFFGKPDLVLNARLGQNNLVYDLFSYQSWRGIEPEPLLRIKGFPFTMQLVAHGFQFELDKPRPKSKPPRKPAIDWFDPVSKRVLDEQPEHIEVSDLNDSKTAFTVTFKSRGALITSFFARTSVEGLLFDPTVSEDADEPPGPGIVVE